MSYSRKLASMMALSLGLFAGACADDADSPPAGDPPMSEVKRATATIDNFLAVDGCSYPVKIDGVDYAPAEASLADIRARVGAADRLTVEVEYRVTGAVGHVRCGRALVDLPEIEVTLLEKVLTRATALIEDFLPVDGCSYPITIGDVEYAPDEASLPAIRTKLGSRSSVVSEVDYRLTGRVGRVTCGGTLVDRPEIEVVFP